MKVAAKLKTTILSSILVSQICVTAQSESIVPMTDVARKVHEIGELTELSSDLASKLDFTDPHPIIYRRVLLSDDGNIHMLAVNREENELFLAFTVSNQTLVFWKPTMSGLMQITLIRDRASLTSVEVPNEKFGSEFRNEWRFWTGASPAAEIAASAPH